MPGIGTAIGGALAIAAVSTLGDFIWAAGNVQHRVPYGLAHGTLLFLCVGTFLGATAGRAAGGAAWGGVIGFAAAAGFYLLAPIAGFSAMFIAWFALWIALGLMHARLSDSRTRASAAIGRGLLAAVLAGVAFYLVSGIWRPFDPQGWDYAVHFGAWMLPYAVGFAALLVNASPSNPGAHVC